MLIKFIFKSYPFAIFFACILFSLLFFKTFVYAAICTCSPGYPCSATWMSPGTLGYYLCDPNCHSCNGPFAVNGQSGSCPAPVVGNTYYYRSTCGYVDGCTWSPQDGSCPGGTYYTDHCGTNGVYGDYYSTPICEPACNTGNVCGACSATNNLGTNHCGTVNGSQSCTYTQNQYCKDINNTQPCSRFYDNCQNPFACVNGNTCEKTMGGRVTDTDTGAPLAGVAIAGGGTTDGNGNWTRGGMAFGAGFTFTAPTAGHPCDQNYLCHNPYPPAPANYTGTVGGGGDCGMNCNFKYKLGFKIAGTVFTDWNNNGQYEPAGEPAETPRSGVTVSDGSTTLVSDANGNFNFQGLYPGTYSVHINPAAHFVVSNGPFSITVPPNSAGTLLGITPLLNIGGTVFVDYNANGIFDTEDNGYTGSSLTITANGGVGSTTTSTINGTYNIFDFYPLRTYAITLSSPIPAGYKLMTANPVSVNLGTTDISNINFAIAPLFSINGNVYNDINKNTCYDPAFDKPLYTQADTSVTVKSGTTGNVAGVFPVDNTGNYHATNLLPDKNGYIVSYIQNKYYFMTTRNSFKVYVGTPGKSIACDVTPALNLTCH